MGKFYFNLAKYFFVGASESQIFINKTILSSPTAISMVYITGGEEANVYVELLISIFEGCKWGKIR